MFMSSRTRGTGRVAPVPPKVDGAEPRGLWWPVVGFVWAHRIWPWSPSRWTWAIATVVVYLMARALVPPATQIPFLERQVLLTIMSFAALGIVYTARWLVTRRYVYATRDARFVISRTRRGWLVIEHVARPGTRGAGSDLRRIVAGPLMRAADAQGVTVYAYTRSLLLASRFLDDIPGMRVAGQTGDRYLLVRPPFAGRAESRAVRQSHAERGKRQAASADEPSVH